MKDLLPALLVLLLCVLQTGGNINTIPKVVTYEPREVLNQWMGMDKKVAQVGETLSKQIMPMLLRQNSGVVVSPSCQADILKVAIGLRTFKIWALRMVDAMGRPQAGMMSGTLSSHGAYDQCLGLEVPSQYDPNSIQFRGKYCAVDLRPPLPPKPKHVYRGVLSPLGHFSPKTDFVEHFRREAYNYYHVSMRMGVCAPSSCFDEDIQQIAESVAFSLGQHANVVYCEVKEDLNIEPVQWAIIGVLIFFATLVILASLLEKYCRPVRCINNKRVFWCVVESFSAPSNLKKVVAVSKNEDNTLSCLNGVRFFSITWVILCHTYLFLDPSMFRNGLEAIRFGETIPMQVIANASFSVDSFFFITGVLMAYHMVRNFDKNGWRSFNLLVIILRRIYRILPSAMLAIGATLLLPLLGSGPSWHEEVVSVANVCKETWWRIPLFITNFFPVFKSCMQISWYIAVDMQLFVLALIFFVFLFRCPRIACILVGLYITASVTISAYITWYKGLLPAVLVTSPDKAGTQEYMANTYTLPHNHLGCYCVGLILGTVLARKKDLSIPKWKQCILWPLAILCNMSVVYGPIVWNRGRRPQPLESWLYAGFARTAWGVGLAWLTYACASGNGGWINDILSWRGYTPLNRLTYLVYLFHPLVIAYYLGNMRDIVDVSHPNLVWMFFGNLVGSFLVALFFRLLVEGPLTEIERRFFASLQRRKTVERPRTSIQELPKSSQMQEVISVRL